jgi:cytosine/adenosine deaminase-related metal-dependent hydrolase
MAGMEGRLVIRNGIVPRAGAGATVVVEGRRIARVAAPGDRVEGRPGDWDVDADGRLVVPGGIDAHAHLALGALHRLAALPGRAPPAGGGRWLAAGEPLERRATPERVEPLVRAAALAALRAGVTCAVDLVRGAPGAAAAVLDAEARALRSVGLRAIVAHGARGEPGGLRGGAEEVEAAAAFAGRHAADRTLRGAIGIAGLADASEDLLAAAAGPGRAHGLVASVGEDEADLVRAFERWGKRPVGVLAARGLLSPRAVVAHAGTAVHHEGVALAEAEAFLAIAPRAAMLRGAPVPPLLPFAALEVRIVLGTDGLFPDVAGEAVAAAMLHRQAERTAAPAAGAGGWAAWPDAARLASTFFGAPLGVLEAGALADLAILDWRPTVPLPAAPDGDLALLWAGAPAAWVVVDGEVRLREGRLLGGDEAAIAAAAREAAAATVAGA